mmetsp:Transcript_8200/g.19106  ORF Transcript_8200/g.19106 Transcript_8200/m.19106 type:complete len:230 (+) Transcript_8200:1014-1703(+)
MRHVLLQQVVVRLAQGGVAVALVEEGVLVLHFGVGTIDHDSVVMPEEFSVLCRDELEVQLPLLRQLQAHVAQVLGQADGLDGDGILVVLLLDVRVVRRPHLAHRLPADNIEGSRLAEGREVLHPAALEPPVPVKVLHAFVVEEAGEEVAVVGLVRKIEVGEQRLESALGHEILDHLPGPAVAAPPPRVIGVVKKHRDRSQRAGAAGRGCEGEAHGVGAGSGDSGGRCTN